MDMERVLFRAIQEAGLPSPTMQIEAPIGDDPNIVRYAHDPFFHAAATHAGTRPLAA
jgi:hypothetical protein